MGIPSSLIRQVSAELYERALKRVPFDARQALQAADVVEPDPTARHTLRLMMRSADAAEREGHFVCSDAGVPVYVLHVGTQARFEGDVRQAIVDGFEDLVASIHPPLLPHVTHPLTLQRGYRGRHMPIIGFDLVDGSDHVEIICSPKALGTGRWEALETFSFPDLRTIETFVLDVVLRAGSQPCPPVVIGVGIGGTMEQAARMAKEATLRPIGSPAIEPMVAAMEARLLQAVNELGFGPMGTGGRATASAVHIDYGAGHGFTPVAVAFNCWINRRTRARLYNDGRCEVLE
jgi:fumarate hydratase subunit alpha